MHVEHFMTKNPIAVDASDTVTNVARHMRDKDVGSVVVLRNGKVAGIVTDRQLTVGVLADGKSGEEVKVEDVMTKDVGRLSLDDNIFAAVDTLRSSNVARRVPVVNDRDELVGIVSISDIAVIAKDLVDAVMLEETHHALEEARIMTGAKRFVHAIRRPTKLDRLPPEQETVVVREPTAQGLPPGSGQPGPEPGGQAPKGKAEGRVAPSVEPDDQEARAESRSR